MSKFFIPKLVDYYKRGLFPFDRMVKKYPISEIERAFADSANGTAIKPVLMIKE
ncbi:hypothetical protein [Curtanaerobium respiraculi]|uniref:hypothetical protein n=1 Tax=Curtanaerobium respiraculi TaxID=2949669 RepID=UPI0024B36838|nr:hypothetical protein [Curtanaerobium respiraculi]